MVLCPEGAMGLSPGLGFSIFDIFAPSKRIRRPLLLPGRARIYNKLALMGFNPGNHPTERVALNGRKCQSHAYCSLKGLPQQLLHFGIRNRCCLDRRKISGVAKLAGKAPRGL